MKRFCKQYVMLNKKLPFAKYLSYGIWAAVITHENFQFTLSCQASSKQSTSVDIKPHFAVLNLNNDCQASNKYMRLPGHFNKND